MLKEIHNNIIEPTIGRRDLAGALLRFGVSYFSARTLLDKNLPNIPYTKQDTMLIRVLASAIKRDFDQVRYGIDRLREIDKELQQSQGPLLPKLVPTAKTLGLVSVGIATFEAFKEIFKKDKSV